MPGGNINPVQHSERRAGGSKKAGKKKAAKGINPVQHSERSGGSKKGGKKTAGAKKKAVKKR